MSSDPESDIAYWTSPLGRTATFAMMAHSGSQLTEGEGGAVGVATQSVTIQPVLLELSALPSAPTLLGVQVLIDASVQQAGSGSAERQVNAIVPLEFGYAFDSEAGPLSALAEVMSDGPTTNNAPTNYPVGSLSRWSFDCTQHPSGSGTLGCFCDCWRTWKTKMDGANDAFRIALVSAGLLGLAALLACGAICIATLPAGTSGAGSVALGALCVKCLKYTLGTAIGLVLTAIPVYSAAVLVYWGDRESCISRCGLYSSPLWDWHEVEPAKIAND